MKYVGIDLSAEAAAQGMFLLNSLQGMEETEAKQMMAANSLRPFIDPNDPTSQYVTVVNRDAAGKLVHEAVRVGNAEKTTLLRGEWEMIDEEVSRVAVGEMKIVNMLIAAGLVKQIDGMGITKYTWQRSGKMGKARIDMDMTADVDAEREEFDEDSIPIPVISSGYDLNMRYLAASRKTGVPADMNRAYWAAYAVADFTEQMFINGAGNLKAAGGQIYGLRTTPKSVTKDMTTDWNDDSMTGEDIVDEVASWISTMKAQHHYGPFVLLLPERYSYKLTKDYKAESDKSIYTRLLELKELSKIEFSEYLHKTAAGVVQNTNEAFLLEMSKKTIMVLDGMGLTDFQYQIKGPFTTQHKVAQIRVPLFRDDMDGQTGLLYASMDPTPEA